MASSTPANEQPSDSDISTKVQYSIEEKHESSFPDSAQSTNPSVLVNGQAPGCEISLGDQAVDENCDSAPSVDTQLKPLPSSANEQTPGVGSQVTVEEKCGVSHSDNSNTELKSLSVSELANGKIPESETSLRTKSSSEENSDSQNVQSVLVSGTAMCLNLDSVKDLVCHNTEKKIEEAIPLAVSAPKKLIEKDDHRTSKYHGVTRHFWTGKFEAHLWDNSYIREGHRRKGKQVFLGQYDNEEKAARAYDLVALKYWGPNASTKLNFPISSYEKELEGMNHMSREEFVMFIRRKSCFKKGSSIYRGVTRHGDGRWQARISGIPGRRGLHLGTFSSEEEAAKAYDIASIKYRGMKAFTNFDVSNYSEVDLKESEGEPEPKRLKKKVELTASTIVVAKSDPQPDVIAQTDITVRQNASWAWDTQELLTLGSGNNVHLEGES
ncbi:AP2/ERF domain [Macleaya cordata]|uniref:AP2/ERF domain n=1 Tax=Macleaya cordata TaxID=56857 RepID=A0A200QS78_MACCD|nr:AP2/ERF domain [Macleaya cordata]